MRGSGERKVGRSGPGKWQHAGQQEGPWMFGSCPEGETGPWGWHLLHQVRPCEHGHGVGTGFEGTEAGVRRCWFSGVQVWTGAPPPAVLGLQLSETSQPPSLRAPVPPNKPFYAVGSVSLETPMQGLEGK